MKFDLLLAQKLLAPHVAAYRAFSYSELTEKILRGDVDTFETNVSGVLYRFEFKFFWHDEPYNHIYVTGSVYTDAMGASVKEEFILSSSGRFVGE